MCIRDRLFTLIKYALNNFEEQQKSKFFVRAMMIFLINSEEIFLFRVQALQNFSYLAIQANKLVQVDQRIKLLILEQIMASEKQLNINFDLLTEIFGKKEGDENKQYYFQIIKEKLEIIKDKKKQPKLFLFIFQSQIKNKYLDKLIIGFINYYQKFQQQKLQENDTQLSEHLLIQNQEFFEEKMISLAMQLQILSKNLKCQLKVFEESPNFFNTNFCKIFESTVKNFDVQEKHKEEFYQVLVNVALFLAIFEIKSKSIKAKKPSQKSNLAENQLILDITCSSVIEHIILQNKQMQFYKGFVKNLDDAFLQK
eukprot:TRINITY_DN1505_c0_g1_i6.p2 TRINITY_DN1505_c0_g1~~TRINITY_DN1505_c0_g1_i6.p2  ORF type:complete len:311 (-),score=46.96 TRINITY_DN1505_c0_g1_i6:115-1047(-)